MRTAEMVPVLGLDLDGCIDEAPAFLPNALRRLVRASYRRHVPQQLCGSRKGSPSIRRPLRRAGARAVIRSPGVRSPSDHRDA